VDHSLIQCVCTAFISHGLTPMASRFHLSRCPKPSVRAILFAKRPSIHTILTPVLCPNRPPRRKPPSQKRLQPLPSVVASMHHPQKRPPRATVASCTSNAKLAPSPAPRALAASPSHKPVAPFTIAAKSSKASRVPASNQTISTLKLARTIGSQAPNAMAMMPCMAATAQSKSMTTSAKNIGASFADSPTESASV